MSKVPVFDCFWINMSIWVNDVHAALPLLSSLVELPADVLQWQSIHNLVFWLMIFVHFDLGMASFGTMPHCLIITST
jgi:hypothetical protein